MRSRSVAEAPSRADGAWTLIFLVLTKVDGCHHITAKLDRMFRSAADALATLEEFKAQEIGLHMIDLGGDVCCNGISKLVFTTLSAGPRTSVIAFVSASGMSSVTWLPKAFTRAASGLKLVPNADEQAALARIKAMHRKGSTYRAIGSEFGKDPKTVQCIL
jgi:hypothetical protein